MTGDSDRPPLGIVEKFPDRDNGQKRVIAALEVLLESAKRGDILGIAYVTEEPTQFGWGKVNMTYPMVLGALERAKHHINKQWDQANQK